MNEYDDQKSAGNDSKVRLTAVRLNWPRLCFEAESRAEAGESPRLPPQRPTLKAGARVSFEFHEGVDGPAYATEVRLIEPE